MSVSAVDGCCGVLARQRLREREEKKKEKDATKRRGKTGIKNKTAK